MPHLPDLPPEAKIIAAHMAATAAAFQVLVTALQEAGALQPGAFPEMLRLYVEGLKQRGNADPMVVALLGDLRRALIN